MSQVDAKADCVVITKRFAVKRVEDDHAHGGDRAIVIAGLDGDLGAKAHATTGNYGVAIAGRESHAKAFTNGVALAGDGGTASTGAAGAAICGGDGTAEALDGGVAFVAGYNGRAVAQYESATAIVNHNGVAEVAFAGIASVQSGSASAAHWGYASVREGGKTSVGPGGVAINWNLTGDYGSGHGTPDTVGADPALLTSISAGDGGLIISYVMGTNGRRQPVIGLVGDIQANVQAGLEPGKSYKLVGGKFVPV